jgi:hypothetical protein
MIPVTQDLQLHLKPPLEQMLASVKAPAQMRPDSASSRASSKVSNSANMVRPYIQLLELGFFSVSNSSPHFHMYTAAASSIAAEPKRHGLDGPVAARQYPPF